MPRQPSVRVVPGIGDELRARMKAAGMTQVELANAAHVSRPTLNRALREDRISAENEEAINAALARGRSSKPESQFRPLAGWARATDLVRWADFRESQAEFPDVVRGLVRTTASGLTTISFRAGEGIQLEGWDGRVVASGSTPFVPQGESGWEIGTSARIEEKAQGDYEKRTANPLGVNPKDTTFVFVTPRRWSGKDAWAEARRAEKIWKDVRVLDADDVEQWLQDAPSVHLRLSRLLGTLPAAAHDLPYWWANWTSATRPSLPGSFVLAGRNEQANQIGQALAEPGSVFGVRAESRDEAVAVVAAAIEALPNDLSEEYFARAIVLEDPSAWRALVTSRTRLILIPLVDLGDAVAAAVRAGHTVVLPLSMGDVNPEHTIAVPAVDRLAAVSSLKGSGMEELPERQREVKADALARLARRSMTALRRRIAVATQLRQPNWANPTVGRRMLAALFPGGWNAAIPGDRSFVEAISGKTYADVMSDLEPFTHGSDPILRRRDSLWYVVSREDAWDSLSRFVHDEDVERFRIAATDVLSTMNPQFEMPKDDRWKAGLSDRKPSNSGWLRKAIAETLALIGARMDALEERETEEPSVNAPSLRHVATRVIRDVLKAANEDWRVWASISDLLPELAEAAPDVFLTALEAGLKMEASPVLELFAQESEGMFGGPSPHTGLLWALERLAWSNDHFGSVVRVLAELTRRDPGGRLANRPDASLKAIFRPWMPQTSANVQRRLNVLDSLSRTHEDVAWKILISTLPEFHGVGFYSARPEWREWELPPENVMRSDYEAAVAGAIEKLLTLVGANGERWSELIEAMPRLGSREFEAIAARLGTVTDVTPGDSAAIATALRELVAQHRNFPDADWAMSPKLIDRLDGLRVRFGEADVIAASAWLFTWHPDLPNPKAVGINNHAERDKEVEEERQRVITRIADTHGLDGVLRLAGLADQPSMVGFSAARSGRYDSQVPSILSQHLHAADAYRADFARGFAAGSINIAGDGWVEKTLHELGNTVTADQKGELLALLDAIPKTWELAKSFGIDVERAYWQRVWFVRQSEDVETAARKLIEFGRVDRAADLLGMYAHQKTVDATLVVEVLQRILKGEADPKFLRGNFRHHLSQLFDQLSASPDVSREELGRLEWAYLPALEYDRTPKALHEALAREPEFFVELVSLVFRAEDEPAKDPEAITEDDRQRASRAYSVLHSWKSLPGRREDGTIDENVLISWVEQTRDALRAVNRLAIGDQQIGNMLSGAPSDADGTWPSAAVRAVIEVNSSDHLDRGFAIGKFNSRGVMSRSIGEGGRQERAAAEHYEALAAKLVDTSPRTARLLRDMAADHRSHATREDREAALEEDVEL